MRTRLPRVLTAHDLPLAELTAARLDGEVFPMSLAYAGIGEIDGPALRAESLRPHVPRPLIAERATAAWIWGARLHPPHPAQLCSAIGARGRASGPLPMILREVVIDGSDVVTVSALPVTTPLRTLVDLLRFGDSWEAETCRALRREHRLRLADCRELLTGRRNLPYRRRALERLEECFS